MKKILGIGNALVDILTILDSDEILVRNGVPRGSMQLIDADIMTQLLTDTKGLKEHSVAGGSAANTISGLSHLGVSTGFIGKVGDDEMAVHFRQDMEQGGVACNLMLSDAHTGHCRVMISPDSERTMCTYLGAAAQLEATDLDPILFKGYNIFYIEGYLLQNYELITAAMQQAKLAGLTIALDLASYNVVTENLNVLTQLITMYVDIVFANEEEAKAFTGFDGKRAAQEIAKRANIAVVKLGSKGSVVVSGDECYEIPSLPCRVIDTTGAGDLFAAGFIYGLANRKPLDICAKIGTLCASEIIGVVGAKLDEACWQHIRTLIEAIN